MSISEELAQKTYRELTMGNQPKQESRVWQDPEGYRYLFPWSNSVLLRFFVRKFTDSLPKSEYRRKSQMDDASRSVVRNIEEGFMRAITKEYLSFLSYSQASLGEVNGDVRELTEDKFLKSVPGSSLAKLGIDLKDFNYALRKPRQLKDKNGPLKDVKGELKEGNNVLYDPLKSSKDVKGELEEGAHPFAYKDITELYPPLKKIRAESLNYEIFTELVNKTNSLFRSLVVSLESKLAREQKYYQIEQARLNQRAKGD